MIVRLFDEPPVSGSMLERWYDAVGSCTWVEFLTSSPWAGVFGRRESGFSTAVEFSDDQHAFVVAGGRGYVLDKHQGTLSYQTSAHWFKGAVPIPGRALVAAWTWTDLYLVGVNTERSLGRVALDGIENVRVTSDQVLGEAWQGDGWYAFRLDLDTALVERGGRTRG